MKRLLSMILGILCVLSISSCNSNTESDFNYPKESEFVFKTNMQNVEVKKEQVISIECQIKNNSGQELYIEHLPEPITYVYNSFTEEIDTVAILETLKIDGTINRDIEITAIDSGKITIIATFYVKPAQYSDTSQKYTFTKELNIIVE